MIQYPSVTRNIQVKSASVSSIIASLATGNYNNIIKKIAENQELLPFLKKWVQDKISDEVASIVSVKRPSTLSLTSCDDLLKLKNEDIINELKEKAPLLHLVLQSATTSPRRRKKIFDGLAKDRSQCCLAMSFSVLMRARSPTHGALAYRISMILHHSGAKKRVIICFCQNWQYFLDKTMKNRNLSSLRNLRVSSEFSRTFKIC